ncbi:MAG: class I SAM-dependent DNA methyltransferase [Steroidobacteraceae bacterium]
MSVFAEYAPLYNLMYGEKGYKEEADFVLAQISAYKAPIGDILDLGCGTGAHALRFAKAGHNVLGVDVSAEMLSLAREKLAAVTSGLAGAVEFQQSDIRNLAVNKTFDAVVSLFHVMSYQIRDEDVFAAIAGARRHVTLGCPFLFDFWHGPAVIKSGPLVRRKEVEDDTVRVVRVSTPSWRREEHQVTVGYHFTVDNKATGERREFEESHCMRYFFPEELERALRNGGFRPAKCAEWLSGKQATDDTFSAYMIGVAT